MPCSTLRDQHALCVEEERRLGRMRAHANLEFTNHRFPVPLQNRTSLFKARKLVLIMNEASASVTGLAS